jgi:hypothetical protein
MAVELCKVAIWIETVEPGKPLTFMDQKVRCGDSLVGVYDFACLAKGIPDEAYAVLSGDKKAAAAHYRRLNAKQRDDKDHKQGKLAFLKPPAELVETAREIDALPEENLDDIAKKRKKFEAWQETGWINQKRACDLWTAAFFIPKKDVPSSQGLYEVPLTDNVWTAWNGSLPPKVLDDAVEKAVTRGVFFHWPLVFADVMEAGGFDCVMGNPPWEKLTLFEREYFSSSPEISEESNSSRRTQLLDTLLEERPELKAQWLEAQRQTEALGNFLRGAERFVFTAVGDLNLYPLFTELATQMIGSRGWVGLVLKSVMFTGSTWSKFTDKIITSGQLHAVYDFKNWESIFPNVGYHERFCLASISQQLSTQSLRLAVGLVNPNQISEPGRVLEVDRRFARLVNPDTGTLPQCETAADLKTLSRATSDFKTLSESDWDVRYTRGLDMTTDASLMVDRERPKDLSCQGIGSFSTASDMHPCMKENSSSNTTIASLHLTGYLALVVLA